MQSIKFNKGYKTYAINGDESKVISINIADINLYKKMEKIQTSINEVKEKLRNTKPTAELLFEIDKIIKEQLNYAFGYDFSATVFGELNILSIANDKGQTVIESFMEAFMPIVKRDSDEALKAQKNRMDLLYNEKTSKYIDPIVSTFPQQKVDVSKLTEEQKIALVKELKG